MSSTDGASENDGAATASHERAGAFVSQTFLGLSPALASRLDNWGPELVNSLRLARRAGFARHGLRDTWPRREQLHVGTDCSGAEAPIWALRGMGIQHRHVFSCDVDPRVRSFLASTCPPAGPMYVDMLKRSLDELPPQSVYVCGFPCKAFSTLRRHATKFLREKSAKPFFEVVRVLGRSRPLLAVFENVIGIKAVLSQVLSRMAQVPGCIVIVLPIDVTDLGEPVSRPRYYFLLVRQDVAVTTDVTILSSLVHSMYTACARTEVVDHVSQRMLPSSAPAVKLFIAEQTRKHEVIFPYMSP